MRWPARAFWIKSTCAVLALVAGAEYIRANYKFTDEADSWFRSEIAKFAAR